MVSLRTTGRYGRRSGRDWRIGQSLLETTCWSPTPVRVRRAVDLKAANTLLLKVNQVGTLTEAAEALRIARSAGWMVTISARSGETEDDWLADLAVGWSGDQIKVGSITRSERLAKYNRLSPLKRRPRCRSSLGPNTGRGPDGQRYAIRKGEERVDKRVPLRNKQTRFVESTGAGLPS